MMSLSHRITFWNNYSLRTFNRSTQIGFQLGTSNIAILMNCIYLAIIIKQHRQVINVTIYTLMSPRSINFISNIHMNFNVGKRRQTDINNSLIIN